MNQTDFDNLVYDRSGQRYKTDHVQKKVYVHSTDRIGGTSTRFRVSISDTIENVKSVDLHYCAIPNTQYLIEVGINDTFSLTELANPPVNVVLTEGSYSASELEVELKTQLDSVSPTVSTYTVVLNPTTLKLIITSTGPQFDFTFTGTGFYVLEQYIGFNTGVNSSVLVGGVQTLQSPNVINLARDTELFIKFTNFSNIVRGSDGRASCFIVPVTTNFGSFTIFNENSAFESIVFQSFQQLMVKDLDIELVDRHGQNVNLNGADWSMVLAFRMYQM